MAQDSLGPGGLICSRCGAEFAEEYAFRDHVASHVTGAPDSDYICTACGADFDSQAALDEHAKVHMWQERAA